MAADCGELEIVLLNLWPSMFGARVRIALEEKGLSYEYKEQEFPNKSPLLLEMNPIHKKVPVLIHNGKPVCESLIIVEYINEVWNQRAPSLLPSDPYGKALARFWGDYIEKNINCMGRKITWHKSKEEAEEGKEGLLKSFKVLEGALGDQPYFGGEAFGFVDIALIGFYMWFDAYETFGNFSVGDECPRLLSWAKRCLQRESVSKSLGDPNKVLDLVIHYRKHFGLD